MCVSVRVDAFVNERRTENGELYHYLTWTSISFNPLQDCVMLQLSWRAALCVRSQLDGLDRRAVQGS